MKQFLKENAVLVAGVLLPLALIAVFFIAGAIARAGVADPQYDMLYTGSYDYNGSRWQIGLEKGVLTIRYIEPDKSSGYGRVPPELYRFDHTTKTAMPLRINYRHIVDGVVQDPVIDELNTHVLSAAPVSPDGYQLVHRDSNDGFFPEAVSMLFSPRDGTTNMLRKNSRSIGIPAPPYYDVLIAWVGGKKP